MDLFFKILKISVLVTLIFVLAVLFAPTLKGAFVVIHFSTSLRGWLFAQLVMIGFAAAASMLFTRLLATIAVVSCSVPRVSSPFVASVEPMRC